jgi:YfiH family protein
LVSTHFSNRTGGVSHSPYESLNLGQHVKDDFDSVQINRERLAEEIGPSVFMRQVHGDTVVVVDGIAHGEPVADALITQESGIALVVLVADCIPLLLWDENSQCIAVVHVGRRGLVNGITNKVLGIMESMGALKIQAHLGPSICGKCYEVGEDVYQNVGDLFSLARSTTEIGFRALDLPAALSGVLLQEGVNVTRSPICTVEDDNYFSYRRDGITGRQAGAIWM